MDIEEFYDWWMENKYPHKKYVNVLSKKWTIEFTKDFLKFKDLIYKSPEI